MSKTIRYFQLFCILAVLATLLASCMNLGYVNNGDEVTWNTFEENGLNKYHVNADPKTFKKFDDGYAVDKDYVFYKGRIVEKADPKSIRTLGMGYAVDDKGVYCSGSYIDCIDPASVKVHSYYLTEDKSDFFWNNKPLNVRDKVTFEVLDSGKGNGVIPVWAKDKYNAYFLGECGVIPDIDSQTFHQIEAKGQSGSYAADSKHVYFKSDVVPGADPSTFAEVAFYIGQDGHRVYKGAMPTGIKDFADLTPIGRMYSDGVNVYDSDFEILPDADATTFTVLYQNWYKDAHHVWWSKKVVHGVDPQTFSPLAVFSYATGERRESSQDFNYGKDRHHVFFRDSIIEGADPISFEKIDFPDSGSWVVFDRYRIYSGQDSPMLREYLKARYVGQ